MNVIAKNTDKNYHFYPKDSCNMCGESSSEAKSLGLRLNRSQGKDPKKLISGIGVIVLRCRSCGLVYSNPQPVPHSIDDHYGIPPETYWSNLDYEPGTEYFQDQINTAKALLDFKLGMKALDIGLGVATGESLLEMTASTIGLRLLA